MPSTDREHSREREDGQLVKRQQSFNENSRFHVPMYVRLKGTCAVRTAASSLGHCAAKRARRLHSGHLWLQNAEIDVFVPTGGTARTLTEHLLHCL